MSIKPLLLKLIAFKTWANDDLFPLVLGLNKDSQAQERHNATRVLNHIYVVDKIFHGNLQRQAHGYSGLNTPETPALDDLFRAQQAADQWLDRYVDGLSDAELAEAVDFTFVDSKSGRMTRAEMLMHLITHGGYHRGAVGRILFQAGVQPPPETLTTFMHRAP
ncbi:DinB family protein [Roseateles oligotrophus]|uniref:DinB family protein n=1 Tax=Roseateles oligotrophus TaxID=1769250 RepID=A0ABT2YF05_9BURK|nr:DinB family protein [Roseateles oligotrophus]MCV2368636.1 DinB family protein [Roseateles oligotrophus]